MISALELDCEVSLLCIPYPFWSGQPTSDQRKTYQLIQSYAVVKGFATEETLTRALGLTKIASFRSRVNHLQKIGAVRINKTTDD